MPGGLITVGQIIDQTFDHYRKHFVELISVSAWFLILALLFIVAFAYYPNPADLINHAPLSFTENMALYLTWFTTLVVAPVLGIWIFTTLLKLIKNQLDNKRSDLRKLAEQSWKYFWPMVLINVLFMLLIAAPLLLIVPGLVLTLVGATTAGNLAMIGTFLMITAIVIATVLVFWWGFRYFFISYALVIDDKHGKAAFKKSQKLIQGRFWSVLWRLVAPKIVFILFFAIIQFVITFIILTVIQALAGLNAELAYRLLNITQILVAVLITIFLHPLLLTADLLVYESAKSKQ